MKLLGCVIALVIAESSVYAASSAAKAELKQQYELNCNNSSDIQDHIPSLMNLSKECASVTEIGLRDMYSTWGVLQGLSENNSPVRVYTGIDLAYPPSDIFRRASTLSEKNDIIFNFINANDMDIDIKPTDMLFIDSLHTYCHLTYELEKFSSKVNKYIAMHDTDEPWGFIDDFQQYHGDKSEYPANIDRNKQGLWQAVLDFLERHPEWTLHQRKFTSHGFTVLKRVGS